MNERRRSNRVNLEELARQAMLERDLLPDFEPAVQRELSRINAAAAPDGGLRDLRHLLWCSIDNDDSRDLDQLTVAERLANGSTKICVAIADVDALVRKGSAIDGHAQHNTTSVYTAGGVFPMLPTELSTDLTSLNPGQDRIALVIEAEVSPDGTVAASDVYRAVVHNYAQLAYNAVDAWLDGRAEMPQPLAAVKGLDALIRLQDEAAVRLRENRHQHGALDLETIEARAVFDGDKIVDLKAEERNQPKDLIEDFMIAANGVTARFLASKKFPSIRRVVREPERWARIVQLAEEYGERLPETPDAKALEEFLLVRKKADPVRFPDLSLSIIKLMGAGEYVVEAPGMPSTGHFGLAVRDYAHSTAPNRRYPDLITQRLVKAALANGNPPYTMDELGELAAHCTKKEDDANKVERQVGKSAAALLLASHIGERYDGIVTGASAKGTWVRVFHPPVEGKLVHGESGLDVGDKVRVKLINTDVERGFIDFARVRS